MRQHLIKYHSWTQRPLKYLLSLNVSRNSKSPIYECETCLLRFTHRQRHLDKNPGHEVYRVQKSEFEVYPAEYMSYLESQTVGTASQRAWVEKFCDSREKTKKTALNKWEKETIIQIVSESHGFHNKKELKESLVNLKHEKNYTWSSMRKITFDIKQFAKWARDDPKCPYKFSLEKVYSTLEAFLKDNARDSKLETKMRQKKRFTTVPPFAYMCDVQEKVEKVIDEGGLLDSQWLSLTLQEKLALLLFQIHSRANCRVGILLNFSVQSLRDYQPEEPIESNDHKTGSLYTNYTYFTQQEKNLLLTLLHEWTEKFNAEPETIFPGSEESENNTQSATIARVMLKLFKERKYRFHPNSCQKSWETYYAVNKAQFPQFMRHLFEKKHWPQPGNSGGALSAAPY